MKKGWISLAVLAICLAGITVACMAQSKVKIIIDGKVNTTLQPQIVKGQILVGAEAMARAMQASTRWDKAASTLHINRVIPVDEIRLSQLERALAPDSAEAAAKSWAEAVGSRNGAWQYALLCPELKVKSESDYKSSNWVTGCSSPWVEAYRVTPYHPEQSKAIQYQVDYFYVTSTGWAGQGRELLTIANQAAPGYQPEWAITAREDLLLPEIKGLNFENHARLGDFNLLAGLPAGWKLTPSANQLLLVDQTGHTRGKMELQSGSYLPDHSQTLKEEPIEGVYGQGRTALLQLSGSATSGAKTNSMAVYSQVPLKNDLWLQLTFTTTKTEAEAALNLARDITRTVIVFPYN